MDKPPRTTSALGPPPGPELQGSTTAGRESTARHEADVRLVQDILGGSHSAWAEFIGRYAGLIAAVIRRYLHRRDQEDLRTVYVNVLTSLYQGKLAGYEGRAALSTWLCVVARSEVLDHLRHRFGRRAAPRGLRGWSDEERLIFELYFVQGLDLRIVVERLRLHDPSWTLSQCLPTLRAIEDKLDDRILRRIAYDLHAQSTGAASGRLLEYLDHVRSEYTQNDGAHSPEYHIMEREARRTVDRLREIISGMDARDRMLLELRFERGWSAERIADELGLEPRRRVYTALERILRGLRRSMGEHRGSQHDDS